MLKKLFTLLCFSFLIYAGEDESSINFYNAGGHAALVTVRGRPPLICDAGYITHRVIDPVKLNISAPLMNDVLAEFEGEDLDPATYDNRYPLSVIVSHPSKDHYNLIVDILTELRANNDTLLRVHTILGGNKADYPADLLETLTDIHRTDTGILHAAVVDDDFMRFSGTRVINNAQEIDWLLFRHPDGDEETLNWNGNPTITHLLGQTDLGIVPQGGGSDFHDQQSIVTRVEIPNWSVVFQGDAVNAVTRRIIQQGIALDADILHASLQGGGVDRANNQRWIRHINTRYGIFSAGSHAGHKHPRAEVIERFFFAGNRIEENRPPHFLHYYNPKNRAVQNIAVVHPVTQYDGIVGNTRHGIYTTFTCGAIRFNSQNAAPVVERVALPGYLP
ncbi:MAG: hypothetical protein ACH349_02005 [Candidatus Rhabdochlamydia sp.]|nr:hypothetical protein [Alphaproteobacteria bacterium]